VLYGIFGAIRAEWFLIATQEPGSLSRRVHEGFDKRFWNYFIALIVAIRASGFNYLQIVVSLSRRRRGFKSRRGRQLNNLGEKCLLSV
jgi:hypothetical protein